jgi:hypothetical protein
MKSLSILCVGGRGQPKLAGRSGGMGGGCGAEKVLEIKKLGLLRYIPSTKYFILVNKKCAK